MASYTCVRNINEYRKRGSAVSASVYNKKRSECIPFVDNFFSLSILNNILNKKNHIYPHPHPEWAG